MKAKIAKRSASQYEDSLSSHESCTDTILTHFQFSSSIISSLCHQKLQDHLTPPKNLQKERTFSLKKLFSEVSNEWGEVKNETGSLQNSSWYFQSQDSKLRKKQTYYKQEQNPKYRKHAKLLKFDQQTVREQAEKENEPLILNTGQLVSSDENEQQENLQHMRNKLQKRKVGRILYHKEGVLWTINQQDSRVSQIIK